MSATNNFASIFPAQNSFAPDTLTENGSPAFSTSLSANLDFFSSVCRADKKFTPEIANKIDRLLPLMWVENPLLTLKNLAYKRDCREGAGEKAIFYHAYNWLFTHHPETAYKNLSHIPFYGSWKDLLNLLADKDVGYDRVSKRNKTIAKIFSDQLKLDQVAITTRKVEFLSLEEKHYQSPGVGVQVSLAAKWAPSLDSSYDKKFKVCKLFANELSLGGAWKKQYRQMLSGMRAYLNVVERDMCAREFNRIKLDNVPSIAMQRYKKAFKKHLGQEFDDWINRIKNKTGKVNAKQLAIHELISPTQLSNALTEHQWNAIREDCKKKGKLGRMLPIADVSSSMAGIPMEVSTALGILISELAPEPFNGLLITFSESPTFFQMKGQSLAEKVRSVKSAPWGGNTNFNKVFDILLERCIQTKVDPEKMPEAIICISDMQFDCCDQGYKTNYQVLKDQYIRAGYKIPSIIFWNVRGDTSSTPVTKDEKGVCMISGFSQNLLKSVLDGDKIFDPTSIMLKALNDDRYTRLEI